MNAMLAAAVTCFVGCDARSPGGDALKVLECDAETGAARIVQSVDGCEGTTYFQLSADRRSLYSFVADLRGCRRLSAAVRFDVAGGRLGKMTRLAELPCETPCHVALSPDGGSLSFAAYLSGTYAVCAADGSGLRVGVLPDDAPGPRADRQQKAYAHQTFYTPDGALMGVCDLGCDRINFYRWREAGGLLSPALSLKADPGDGPRHAFFSRLGDALVLFVVNELSSTVASFAFDGAAFAKIGKWSTLPAGCALKPSETKAAALKATADGKMLMASNRGHDSIAFFAVGADGALAPKGVARLRGSFPRDFELMPGERFMVVGHKTSNEIQVYSFDRAACALAPVGEPIPCWRPLCFKFAER
ncbi:MAG: lactonase family protein [Kiritimatiellae bacterium]|nr:lactonase family protein [Kiritimatiellia bacterium]